LPSAARWGKIATGGGDMNIRFWRRAAMVAFVAALLALGRGSVATNGDDFAPDAIAQTASRLGWVCVIRPLCPVTDDVRTVIKRAIAGDRSAAYLLGLTLVTGDGLRRDEKTGLVWIVRAAELGEPDAARDIAGRLRNGAAIEADETKIAGALKPQADAGDAEAMRALGPMLIGGRGVKQDPVQGLNLLKRAAEGGSSDAETDLSQLYLNGGPGVPANRPEAMKWLAASARHANVDAMLNLGYMAISAPINERSLADGFCWLTRSALLDQPQAQEKLSTIFAEGEHDDHGAAIAIDLIQADLWFRLAARSPYHNNSQIRSMIEPHMTTEQLGQAKRLFEAWRPRTIQELKTMPIPLPAATPDGASPRNCPAMT
jgi:TPR repeat protein